MRQFKMSEIFQRNVQIFECFLICFSIKICVCECFFYEAALDQTADLH